MPLIQQVASTTIGTPIGSGSSGSVLFIDSSGNLAQDNTNFNFNDTTNSLIVGGNIYHVAATSSGFSWQISSSRVFAGRGDNLTVHLPFSINAGATNGIIVGNGNNLSLGSSVAVNWTAGAPGSTADLILLRGGAGTLEQRDGVNAQTFRVYNTYTDTSNYERAYFQWSGNIFYVGTQALGTGTVRNLLIGSGSDTVQLNGVSHYFRPSPDNTIELGTTTNRWSKGWFGSSGLDVNGSGIFTGTLTLGTGGTSRTTVREDGITPYQTFTILRNGGASLTFSSQFIVNADSQIHYNTAGTASLSLLPSTTSCVWAPSTHIVEQRNTTNPQTFSLYNTYTDASNYERLRFVWASNIATIIIDNLGTGSVRSLAIRTGASGAYTWTYSTAGQLTCPGAVIPQLDDTSAFGGTSNRWNKGWFGTGGIDLTGSIIFNAKGTLSSPSTDILRWTNNAATGVLSIQVNATVSQFTGTSNLWTFQNSTSAQTLRLQRTYTDGSNQAYLESIWSGNNCLIRTVGVGTGTAGSLILSAAGGVAELTLSSASNSVISNSSLVPAVTLTRSIGSQVLRWTGLYGQLIDLTPADNTVAVTVAGSTLTAANAQSLISISQTWNTTGSPTGFLANFTNTASGASTNLFDWQLAGVSQFKLHKSTGLSLFQGGQTLTIGSAAITSDNGSFTLSASAAALIWGSNVLIQRRTTNAQTFQLTRTYTDASNYALLEQTWSGNNALIRTVGLGTGTVGDLILQASTYTFTFSASTAQITLPSPGGLSWTSRSQIKSTNDGLINLLNAASSSFTALAFGPETTSFPALVRNADGIDMMEATRVSYSSLRCLNIGLGTASTTTAFQTIAAGTTAKAQINLATSTAPSSPVDGDIWFDGTDLKIRVSGVTYTLTKT